MKRFCKRMVPALSKASKLPKPFQQAGWLALSTLFARGEAMAQEAQTNSPSVAAVADEAKFNSTTNWNWHLQNTDILDAHPGFPAKYSGPNSLSSTSEVQETVSLDLLAGLRVWEGGELHVDGLMWQGFGFSKTLGVESFPNTEAFRVGTKVPNVTFTRAFFRQVFGLGGDQETVAEDAAHVGGKQDVSRVTVTIGKLSAKDIFDNNRYANDPRTQFLSWGLSANQAWDYPADSLGYDTGLAVELNQPNWTARYGFFQMPRYSNGLSQDKDYLNAWGMVSELERRFSLWEHPGAVRLLGYLNHAHMGSYEAVVDDPSLAGNIVPTREYRYKYGFGVNVEQEIVKGIGAFARVGWSDGHTEAWVFSDVDESASFGFSVNGGFWKRDDDTFGVAAVFNGASPIHRRFFQDGGTGILAGDGNLTYGAEESMETYYDFSLFKGFHGLEIHGALDYQFIANPAFNGDRGPVSVISARLHWEF